MLRIFPQIRLSNSRSFCLKILLLGATIVFFQIGINNAIAGSLWSMSKVQVDQINIDSRSAKDLAILDGQYKALQLLFQRLTAPADWTKLPRPAKDELANLVEGFEVTSERALAQRYTAQLTISFHANAVRNFLKNAGVSIFEPSKRPFLIVPLMADQTNPFDGENKWRQIWINDPQNGILVPWKVLGENDINPQKTAENINPLTSAESLFANPAEHFSKRLAKNDTILVMVAMVTMTPDGLKLSLNSSQPKFPIPDQATITLQINGNESTQQLLNRALISVSQLIDDQWKINNASSNLRQQKATLVFQLQSLNELLQLNAIIDTVPQIQSRSLTALHRRGVQYDMVITSDLNKVKQALVQRGLSIQSNGDAPVFRFNQSAATVKP